MGEREFTAEFNAEALRLEIGYLKSELTAFRLELVDMRREAAADREKRHCLIGSAIVDHVISCKQVRRLEYMIIALLCGGAGGGAVKLLGALMGG